MLRRNRSDLVAWEAFGSEDPDWAVLTDHALRGGGWAEHLDEFYASGRHDVATDLDRLPDLLASAGRETAVDWGCGTGRLSFALAEHFARVVSVDLASSMLDVTRRRAAERGITNLELVRVEAFVPCDAALVYSAHVVQHMRSHREMRGALATMCSSVGMGGYLIVDVPSRLLTLRVRAQPRYRLWSALSAFGVPERVVRKLGGQGMSMRALTQAEVKHLVEEGGLDLLSVSEGTAAGVVTAHYVAQRRPSAASS
jgi:SAM-dependent methyltransferase